MCTALHGKVEECNPADYGHRERSRKRDFEDFEKTAPRFWKGRHGGTTGNDRSEVKKL
jgi:hypothetical protein